MEDHIKQRLTGAAIVVAVLVLLVPEMFRGRPAVAPAASGDAQGGPPVRSYTIELRDGAVGAPRTAPTAPTTSDQPALAAPAEAAAPPPEGAAVAAPAQTVPVAVAQPPAGPAGGAPAVEPAGPAAPAPAATGADEGAARYQVQLGLFASRANADRLAAKVVHQGVRVAVSGPDARGLYRVHTATYATREAAQAVQQKLRELGLTAALTPQR